MAHAQPLTVCRDCKKNKVKSQDHQTCYQCFKKSKPAKGKK